MKTLEEKKADGFRSFSIRTSVRFPSGRKVAKSDYLETNDQDLIELFGKASRSNIREIELRVTGPAIVPAPLPPAPPAGPQEDEGDVMPDWQFITIPKMRVWIDQCGLTPLGKRMNKAKHEDACRQAWESGLRPHPLYGLPGGPTPGPGFASPVTNLDTVAKAVAECDAMGLDVPEAARAFLSDDHQGGDESPAEEEISPQADQEEAQGATQDDSEDSPEEE